MTELIATIVLIISIIGMGAIVWRKIPVLVKLPEALPQKEEPISLKLKTKARALNPFKNFSYEIFLQKIISKIRILTLKTDNQTFNWLQKLREKNQKKNLKNDNYWEEVKKSTQNDHSKNNLPG